MKLIINISEERYTDIQRIASVQGNKRMPTVEQIIANGTPLPKEHGRLIDADVLVDGMEDDYELCELVNSTPTIIEAESEDT